ncbi:organic hydroperoxide resistance protein [Mycobacterium sp. E740]|nr:organic hydroperoxide resistance protein [Mycobacterium sp. E740]
MIEPMSIEVVFTAESTASGGGRDGHVKSSDGRIDLDTRPPKEAGGSGEGTNPEQLFSAGYAACFLGALRLVAKNNDVKLDDATGITAQVGFGKDPEGGFGINAHLIGYLPGLEQRAAEDLMNKAHQVCPYSKATRGNIDVKLSAKV